MNAKRVLSTDGRGLRLAIVTVTTLIIFTPRFVAIFPEGRGWELLRETIVYSLMASLPFLLSRTIPEAADFDRQWLPFERTHWLWFFVMLVLLLMGGGIATWISGFPKLHTYSFIGQVSPIMIVAIGVIMIVIGPIAEEVYWRAYCLEQLQKVTFTYVALPIQSLFFALSHRWLLYQGAVFLIGPFWYGMVLGTWRIRFRSILPLVVAHVLLNAVVLVPALSMKYAETAHLWSKPPIQQIVALTNQPTRQAVPGIIAFLGDADQEVSNYAVLTLTTRYKHDAESYLKKAIAAGDTENIKNVLFVIELLKLSDLAPDIRSTVWFSDNRSVRLAAMLALRNLGDEEGLQAISQSHSDQTVRSAAKTMLENMQVEEGK